MVCLQIRFEEYYISEPDGFEEASFLLGERLLFMHISHLSHGFSLVYMV